ATFTGNLEDADVLPVGVFDCIVLTQTLQFVFDMRAGVRTLYRALKPGGVLLLTVPGIARVDNAWPLAWSLTVAAARRLLEERFRSHAVVIEVYGNVFAATASLYGLAVEELERSDLDVADVNFPVIIAARAIKSEDA